ncbi:hypothetical protein EJ06DRAFT_254687 [Trichodelitschia bisporula]|uniref:Uncharacterized protein n=1 Tax=Trichodelitschia bisporula TaxID=703511 RepID=A0A6G1HJI2_9PEZI|nr:hypothetical protein EJ06DRAFT_254687 [Trichodelitschia bisporula]
MRSCWTNTRQQIEAEVKMQPPPVHLLGMNHRQQSDIQGDSAMLATPSRSRPQPDKRNISTFSTFETLASRAYREACPQKLFVTPTSQLPDQAQVFSLSQLSPSDLLDHFGFAASVCKLKSWEFNDMEEEPERNARIYKLQLAAPSPDVPQKLFIEA